MLTRTLGVIRFSTQQRIQERFASGLVASTMRFDRNKNSVDFTELFRIVQAQNPATVRFTIHVQNAEIHCAILLARFSISLSPDLESARILYAWFVIEIERIEDQGLVLCIENTAERLASAAATVDVKHVGDIQFARAHEFTNITIGRKILLIVF